MNEYDINDILFGVIAVSIVVIVGLWCFFPDCHCEIIGGGFILGTAIATSWLAIHKYHSEQRTSRIQKLYFEDTLLGEAKSIENIMSQCTNNLLVMENFYKMGITFLKGIIPTANAVQGVEELKVNNNTIMEEISRLIEASLNGINSNVGMPDFLKERISIVFTAAKALGNIFPTWITQFEQDACRFGFYLKKEIIFAGAQLRRINSENDVTKESLDLCKHKEIAQMKYVLIDRHYILLSLFSILIWEFCKVNYTSVEELYKAFETNEMKKIILVADECYKKLIIPYENVNFDTLYDEHARELSQGVEWAREKIRNLDLDGASIL